MTWCHARSWPPASQYGWRQGHSYKREERMVAASGHYWADSQVLQILNTTFFIWAEEPTWQVGLCTSPG